MTLASVNLDDLEAVVALALLTESRDNAEQKSLLAVAERVDKLRNAKVSRNVYPAKDAMWARDPAYTGSNADEGLYRIKLESTLEREVDASRNLEPEQGERRIKPSWERKRKR